MAKKRQTKRKTPASSVSGTRSTPKRPTKAPPQPTIYICPYTNQNVYICKATLKDLKAKSTYTNTSRKRLWIIQSPQVRNDLYVEAAEAIASTEQNLLPSYGGRSWEVTCKLTEPHWSGQVLFRTWKGEMELAVLPHLLEKIPEPPTWPGKKLQPDEYESDDDERGLQQREISSLSSVAWDLKDSYPVPSITLKWQSPERKIFNSRKAAWEHATLMASREVQINKCLLGVGSSGKLLQPFFPSASVALKVGKLRFERDGLWVVGQELDWQEDRPEEIIEEEAEEEERRNAAIPKSGLALYLMKSRDDYRKQHPECNTFRQAEMELRKVWKALPAEERKAWNKQYRDLAGEDFDSDQEKEEKKAKKAKKAPSKNKQQKSQKAKEPEEPQLSTTPKAFFVKSRRHEYRKELQEQGRRVTLGEIEIWLREAWKTMPEAEKEEWKQKVLAHDAALAEKAKAEEEAAAAKEAEAAKQVSQDNTKPTDEASADNVTSTIENIQAETMQRESMEASAKQSPMENDTDTAELIKNKPVDSGALEASTQPDSISPPLPTASTTPVVPKEDVAKVFQDEKKEEAEEKPTAVASIHDTTLVSSDAKAPQSSSNQVETKKVSSPSPTTVISGPVDLEKTASKSQRKSKRSKPTQQALTRWCMTQGQMDLCYAACMEHYDTVMRTVKARDLHRELQDGFDVFRERGHGRFDMELPTFDNEEFDFLNSLTKAPWMPIVRAILGEDVLLIHKGCFLSMPGAVPQDYHQDGVHLTTQTQRPCHAINVFVPLVDLNSRNGPTEFCLGSHILGLEGYDRDFVETPKPSAGTPVIFDYRLGHRGLGNSSQSCRPIVYCTYARVADGKEFRDSVNFSRKRYHKIGELSSKPLSREERRNNRKRSIEKREEEKEMQKAIDESSALKPEDVQTEKKIRVDETKEETVQPPAPPAITDPKPVVEKADTQSLHDDAIAMTLKEMDTQSKEKPLESEEKATTE